MAERKEHLEELKTFLGDFLDKRICTKNEFALAAGRLHFLRKFLQTQRIPYNLALSVMERHQIVSDDLRSLKSGQLESILHDLFYAAEKLNFIAEPLNWMADSPDKNYSFDPERQAALLATLLFRIYDPHNNKSVSILELKIVLLLICASKSLEEIIQHNLNLLIDHNRCIHQTRFKSSITAILKLLNHLDGEINCDAETISSLVANSFANVTGLAGMSDTQFYHFWDTDNRKNPNEISYYFTLIGFSRSLDSSAVHETVFCAGCGDNQVGEGNLKPIEGVRFKCKSCSSTNFNLCTLCFFGDFQAGRHNATTHKFTMIEEALSPEENNKHIGLFAKLLKVFYFMRSKRNASPEKKRDEEAVKTIRFQEDNQTGGGEGKNVPIKRGKDQLFTVIEMLSSENRVFQENLEQIQQTCSPDSEFYKYLEQHKNILTAQIEHLREIWKNTSSDVSLSEATLIASLSSPAMPVSAAQKFHSTPFRPNGLKTINWDLTALEDEEQSIVTMGNGAQAATGSIVGESKYIRGAEMDKTYFEANRSNRSLQEISTWLHLRESFCRDLMASPQLNKSFGANPEGMQSFRELLHKVRDILEDTYSDNTQLSTVTRQLETVLDEIIGEEERKLEKTKKAVATKGVKGI